MRKRKSEIERMHKRHSSEACVCCYYEHETGAKVGGKGVGEGQIPTLVNSYFLSRHIARIRRCLCL